MTVHQVNFNKFLVLESIYIGLSLAIVIAGLARDNRGNLIYGIMMTFIGVWCVRGSARHLHITVTSWIDRINRES
jgi:hypothetical protein